MANFQKVFRPEIEIEYKGILGFVYALLAIIKIWIKRATIDITFCGETVQRRKVLIIPKWIIKRAR